MCGGVFISLCKNSKEDLSLIDKIEKNLEYGSVIFITEKQNKLLMKCVGSYDPKKFDFLIQSGIIDCF